MKILWINHRDPKHPQAGGAEVRIHQIGKRLVKMGHQITLLCEKAPHLPKEEHLDGIHIKRIAGKTLIHLLAPLYLHKHQNEYDIIIDDIAHAVPWYSPKVTRKPVIAQIHHIHQEVTHIELNNPLAHIVNKAERTIPKIYEHIITVSNSTKQELIKHFHIDPDKIEVIPNGVDLEKYKPGEKDLRPTILWVGRMKKYKNLDHLLLAYKIVKQKVPEAQLIIIGSGDQEHQMKKLAKELGLKDVHFLGYVPEEEKIMWMQKAWVIVSTSTIEGWGMTITEANACATPAIGYDVPGLRDSIKHMKTGILVQYGNIKAMAKAMIMLTEDQELWRRLAENALNWAKQFDWDKSAERFVKVIESITNG